MSRGLGTVQRAVVAVVAAQPDGLAADAIVRELFGRKPTRAQLESVRRAIRSLEAQGLVARALRRERRPRKSIKRLVSLVPCEGEYCDSCAQRKRRVRLQDWHRRAMRANAKYDPTWLDDLAASEATGFVHATASAERVVDANPGAVDHCDRRVQIVLPGPRWVGAAVRSRHAHRTHRRRQ